MRTFLTGLLSLGLAGTALSAPGPHGPGGRHGDPVRLQRQLGLSDDQTAQLRKLFAEQRKQAIRRHADMQIARVELDEALAAATVDEGVVNARAKALADLQAAAVQARVQQRLAMRKVLTPEQAQKMQQLRHERRSMRGHRGRHGRRDAGPASRPPRPEGPPVAGAGPETR